MAPIILLQLPKSRAFFKSGSKAFNQQIKLSRYLSCYSRFSIEEVENHVLPLLEEDPVAPVSLLGLSRTSAPQAHTV